MKKVLGILLMLMGLASSGVAVLAATNNPVPILGPLVGYDPTGATIGETDSSSEEEDFVDLSDMGSSDGSSESSSEASSSSEEEDPFDFGEASSGSTSTDSSSSSEESTINPDDDSSKPNGSVGHTGMTDFMKKLEAVSTSEMFVNQYKFVSTDMTDPATCYLNFPNDASFTVTEEKETGIVKVETEITVQSTVTPDSLDMVYGKEDLLQVIYEAFSQAKGEAVGAGADKFKAAVKSQKLLVIPEPADIAGVKATLKDGTIETPDFKIAVIGTNFAEFGATAQLSMTLTAPVKEEPKEEVTASSESLSSAVSPGTAPGKTSPVAGIGK